MRAYRIGAPQAFRFAGSQSDAAKTKAELIDRYGLKRTQVSVEEVEIPTAKTELLEFVNELAAQADGKEAD